MAITNRNQLINALANNASRLIIDKASLSNAAAGQFFSLWTVNGIPGAGTIPSLSVVPTNATVGAFSFTNQTDPVTSYLSWLAFQNSNSSANLEIHDRLATYGGLSGTVTTAQGAIDLTTSNPGADRIGSSDYSDVQWWLEVYSAMGATAVNATVGVTYNDGTTGTLPAFALGATPRQGRLYPLITASAGKFIRGVTSVTLSASTGTAGNFGITATRSRVSVSTNVANKTETFDWAQLGLPNIPNNSCLFMLLNCTATTTGILRGQGKLAHG